MAYHGYIRFMKHFLQDVENPKILEIGVHSGQTMIPLIQHYTILRRPFKYAGVDVLLRDYLQVILQNLVLFEKQDIEFHQMTSLDYLKDCNEKYDLILLDGDHNYYTVIREMEFIKGLLNTNGVIVCDDYAGKWAERDEFFSELPEYQDVSGMVKKEDIQDSDKHGVKTAIDEFLENNKEWVKTSFDERYEPILLYRNDELTFVIDSTPGPDDTPSREVGWEKKGKVETPEEPDKPKGSTEIVWNTNARST